VYLTVVNSKLRYNKINVVYIARTNSETAPGIFNKVQQTVEALADVGYRSRLVVATGGGSFRSVWSSMWFMFWQIIKSSDHVIIVRIDIFMPVLSLALLFKRITGTRIIADVPTPLQTWIQEIELIETRGRFWKMIRQFMIVLSFPVSLFPVHRVMQYAPESVYFSIGIKGKTKYVGNGIRLSSVRMRKEFPVWPANYFVMIGVAAIAEWHGYDRMIRGIAKFLETNNSQNVIPYFIIVGDGPVRQKWERMCVEFGVEGNVEFTGFKTGLALDELYCRSHVAISSLGLHRAKLRYASSLKSREYVARGIPFVSAGQDFDFHPSPKFMLLVEDDDSAIDLNEVIKWFTSLNYNDGVSEEIRMYGLERLSFESKLADLI
jgi:glycosyltransferase involved in cell wall biosynthesis